MEPKYPHITVELVGYSGNAFYLLGRVKRAMKEAGCTDEQICEFISDATSADYDHLLQTIMTYVNVE